MRYIMKWLREGDHKIYLLEVTKPINKFNIQKACNCNNLVKGQTNDLLSVMASVVNSDV